MSEEAKSIEQEIAQEQAKPEIQPVDSAAFKAGCKAMVERCRSNGSGWSEQDSVDCIMAAAGSAAEIEPASFEGLKKIVSRLVNPSAFRQWAEADSRKLLIKAKGKRKSKSGDFEEALKNL